MSASKYTNHSTAAFTQSASNYQSGSPYNNQRNNFMSPERKVTGFLSKSRKNFGNPVNRNIFNEVQIQDPLSVRDREIIHRKRTRRPKRVTVVIGAPPEQKKRPEDFGINVDRYVNHQLKQAQREKRQSKFFKIDPFDDRQPSGYSQYLQNRRSQSLRRQRRQSHYQPKSSDLAGRVMDLAKSIGGGSNDFPRANQSGKKLAYGNSSRNRGRSRRTSMLGRFRFN